MTQRTELQRVSDMIDAGERALRHTRNLTDSDALMADELRMDAVLRALEVVGEACKSVSQATRERFPTIPWRQVAGMRDRLIHGYDRVDQELVWATLTHFLPSALPELHSVYVILLTEEPPPPEIPADDR